MSAKDAALERTGSHSVIDDNYSSRADGISSEEVFGYFTATWRSRPVMVTVSADKYAHSSGMSDWRIYASEARYVDTEKNGNRGEDVTATAKSALSKLCAPLMSDWLGTDEYVASFQRALARMILRKFRDDYSASRSVANALVTFESRLAPATYKAIRKTLVAYNAYVDVKASADALVNGN